MVVSKDKEFLSQKDIICNLPPFNKSRLGGANDLGKQAFDPISNLLGKYTYRLY